MQRNHTMLAKAQVNSSDIFLITDNFFVSLEPDFVKGNLSPGDLALVLSGNYLDDYYGEIVLFSGNRVCVGSFDLFLRVSQKIVASSV